MEQPERRWREATRGILYDKPTITARGLTLGCGTLLARFPSRDPSGSVPPSETERALRLLSLMHQPRHPADTAEGLRKALAAWSGGDACLAHIRLAQLGVGTVGSREEARRLFRAAALLDDGVSPCALARLAGIEPSLLPEVVKYDHERLRNPAGNGTESGRWTKAPAAAAPSLTRGLSAEALT